MYYSPTKLRAKHRCPIEEANRISLIYLTRHVLHIMLKLCLSSSTNEHTYMVLHPKLCNINPHNVTHSLMSPNPMEWVFVVQISLLIVTFLSFISQNLSLMQTTQEANPHPHIGQCANMWSVTFFFFFFHHLLNVGACVRHIAQEGQVECITLA